MSKSESSSIQPKSIRQKQILNVAAENPGATLAEIAEQVPSVSTDHVDRVLDQYGDPAADTTETTDNPSVTQPDDEATGDSAPPSEEQNATSATPDPTDTPENTTAMEVDTQNDTSQPVDEGEADSSDISETADPADPDEENSELTEETVPKPEELTQKERETLRAIAYEPRATQKQIAKMLSVSRATVSNRVNAISGFDWTDRDTLVDEVFDEKVTVDNSPNATTETGVKTTGDSSHNEGNQPDVDGAPSTVSGESPAPPNSSVTADTKTGESGANGDTTEADSNHKPPSHDDGVTDTATTSAQETEQIARKLDEFSERLASLEEKVKDTDATERNAPFNDSELLHKVVYACMNSNRISETEELQIIQELIE